MAIPVSLADARHQLRMETEDDSRDDELRCFIADAADWVETYTGHILVERDIVETLDGFSKARLKGWPVKPGTSVSVSYLGAAGDVAVPGVRLLVHRRPVRLLPRLGARWPVVASGTAVTVSYRAGYAQDEVIPRSLARAMLLLIAAYDEDREGGDIFRKAEASAAVLCRPYRAFML